MQFNLGFLGFLLIGVMAAATAAFRLDMDEGQNLALRRDFQIAVPNFLGGDYIQGAGKDEEAGGEGKGKDNGKGKDKAKEKGQGKDKAKDKSQGEEKANGKGQGKDKGKPKDGGKKDE